MLIKLNRFYNTNYFDSFGFIPLMKEENGNKFIIRFNLGGISHYIGKIELKNTDEDIDLEEEINRALNDDFDKAVINLFEDMEYGKPTRYIDVNCIVSHILYEYDLYLSEAINPYVFGKEVLA